MARLNWTEARDACHSIGARLMKMDTKNEGEFVGSHFLKLLSLRKLVKKPWCGLSGPNEGSVAAFRWLDHTAPAFNGWVHYNKTKGWPYRGKCVVMKGLKRGSWFTTDCAHQHPYICKKGKRITQKTCYRTCLLMNKNSCNPPKNHVNEMILSICVFYWQYFQ